MDDLRFPLLSGTSRDGIYPTDHRCPVCGGDFSNGFAYLSGGSLLLSKDGRNSLHIDRLRAFWHVGFHGKDPDMRDSGNWVLVDDVSGGQFDLHCCSIRCLRASLMQILDQLEASIGRNNESA